MFHYAVERGRGLFHACLVNRDNADRSSKAKCVAELRNRSRSPSLQRIEIWIAALQLLLGHTKIESTVRYLGIEVDDALAIAEQIDV
jgi:hypothetical protein